MLRTLFAVHLITAAGFNFVLPFLPLYVRELHGAKGSTFWSGVVFSAPALTMMLASPIWGIVADRWGRKKMLIRATLAGAISLSLMGMARNVFQLGLLRAMQGALTGYQAASNALVAATVPREMVGGSLGLLRTGTWIGVAVGPLLGGVVGEFFGIRTSFFVTGSLLAISTFLVIIFVNETFVSKTGPKRGMFSTYYHLIRIPALFHLYTLSFLDSLARSALLPVFPLYIRILMKDGYTKRGDRGVALMTGVLLGFRAFAGSVSSHHVGKLGDKIGHGRVVFYAALFLTLLYFPQPFLTDEWELIILHIAIGFAAVGLVPGVAALFAHEAPEGDQGATFGLEASVDAFARTIGPLFGAYIATRLGLRSVFGVAAFLYLVLTLIAIPLRKTVAEKKKDR